MEIGRGNMEANDVSSSGSLLAPTSEADNTEDGDCAIKRTRRSIAAIAAHDLRAYRIPSVQTLGGTLVWINRACRALGVVAKQRIDTSASGMRSRSRIAGHEHQLMHRASMRPPDAEGLRGIGHGQRHDPHRKNS
jgi:hypothetical protein